MAPNPIREKLAAGQAVFGCFLRYPDAGLAEMLALQRLDFIVFDAEHGTLSPHECEHLARAVELHGVAPVVRVDENRPSTILRFMDVGAIACHVPGVASAEDAIRAVRAVKFRPDGDRGLAASRARGFGADEGYGAYIATANRETQVIAHIESAAGVEAASEIAAVPGIDVLLVGALDLSHDLGIPGEVEDPRIVEAAERIAQAAGASGKSLGAVVRDTSDLRTWLERGARYLSTTTESLLAPTVRDFLAEVRG